jgi:hypothetical protein
MASSTSITLLKKVQPGLLWYPTEGPFTTEFLKQKSSDPNGPSYKDLTAGTGSVLHVAQRILGRCHPPEKPADKRTGLVVGYVQSGKTMSFETVIVLARDNGYGLVILLAGTKNILLDQSEDRLIKDLGIDDGDGGWSHQANPTKAKKNDIEAKLSSWRARPIDKRAVLVTVLKHTTHLNNLAELLKKLSLTNIPTLIIDDESDQAGLNTRAQAVRKKAAGTNTSSQTYAAILAVRNQLPHHSYLQYTATPQANLLLAQTDLLNPEFAELVHPGNSYTGGNSFFKGNTGLVKVIPPSQVPSAQNTMQTAPKSLLEAFRTFLLVAAHHSLARKGQPKGKDRNRTMMVHPAVLVSSHATYINWIETAQKSLFGTVRRMLKTNPASAHSLFQSEFDSLKATFPTILPLSDLIVAMDDDVFDDFQVVEINGTKQAEQKVKWKDTKYWVLVGAAKLDRGYTVEGLCVTYMPRQLGTSAAADNLQQRARFFGYKKDYLGLCRIYLQGDVKEAFEEYVEHEEFIREALDNHRGKPLADWRRDFILTDLLKPTRPNVIGRDIRRIPADGWMVPGALHADPTVVADNRQLVGDAVALWDRKHGPRLQASQLAHFHKRGLQSNIEVIEAVPLAWVISELLLKFKIKDHSDAEEHSATLIALGAAQTLKHPPLVDIYLMNDTYRSRVDGRSFLASDVRAPINQYFSNPTGSVNDKDHMSPGRISLQLRRLDVGSHLGDRKKADVKDVPWFALHLPKDLRKSLQVELRG